MKTVEIGGRGLAEVNLTIPQGTTLRFKIVHTDEDGHAIDHTSSAIASAVQTTNGENVADLSAYCSSTETGIDVAIPATVSEGLSAGKRYLWDMIVTMTSGEVIRLAYGTVSIIDTYALDE